MPSLDVTQAPSPEPTTDSLPAVENMVGRSLTMHPHFKGHTFERCVAGSGSCDRHKVIHSHTGRAEIKTNQSESNEATFRG